MPDTENKERLGRHAKPPVRPSVPVRDETTLYGDEVDVPLRRKKKPAAPKQTAKAAKPEKAAKVSKKAAKKAEKQAAKAAEKQAAKAAAPGSQAGKYPRVAPSRGKRVKRRRPRVRRSIFEIMSATGNDSIIKPLRLFGHEIRFWPLLLLVIVGLLASGIVLNNNNLSVAQQTITVVGLPEDMEGYRIIVLSDLNGKRFGDVQSLLLRNVNSLKYDAIFCLGDMVGKDGDPTPFYEFLEGLRYPERVYFICGDSDPGPFVSTVRNKRGSLKQLVLEDWILGAIERGANYVDAPMSIQVKNSTLWISPATMMNLETVTTLETWRNQTEQEEDGVVSGIDEDYATLPITSYRAQLAQKLYEAQRTMSVSDVHISLAHERPSDEFIYTSLEHDPSSDRYLTAPELILAGHYCGGVWRLPFVGALYVPDKTLPRGGWLPGDEIVKGLSSVGDTQIYVTTGLNISGSVPLMPFRMFNSPQLSVITLTATLPENMLEAGL